nr:MAG TPA_asm: adenine-specific methyltransferase [Caudoviricetes sp.]
MEYMRGLPDKSFDLAVVDPPYGGGCSQSVKAERERESRGCAAEPQTMRAGAGHASAGFLTNTTSTRRQRRRGRTSLRVRLPRPKRALPARAAHGLSSIRPRADMSATSGIGTLPRRRNTLRS